MSASSFEELREHVGHEIECVTYGPSENPANVAIECVTCSVVLVDFDMLKLPDNENFTNRRQHTFRRGLPYITAQHIATGTWMCSCPKWIRDRTCEHVKKRERDA